MTPYDFSSPRRMSPSAIFILFLRTSRSFFGASFITIFYLFIHSYDDSPLRILIKMAVCIGVIIAIAFLAAFLRYYFTKFHIEGAKLVYAHGYINRRTSEIPLENIHAMTTKRGWIYRLLEMRGLTFDTFADDLQGAELILDETDWRLLLDRVSKGEEIAEASDTPSPAATYESPATKVPNSEIIKAALCQNHLRGFAILAALLIPLYDKITQLGDDTTERIYTYLDDHTPDLVITGWQWFIVLVIIYLTVAILFTSRTLLINWDTVVTVDGARVTKESGLISRITHRLSRDRASVLTFKQNPLEKRAGCCTLTLVQPDDARSATGYKKDIGKIVVYDLPLAGRLRDWWLDECGGDTAETLLEAKSGLGAFLRTFLIYLLPALGAAAIILCTEPSLLWPVAAIAILYTVGAAVSSVMYRRHGGIQLTRHFVRIRGGYIASVTRYVKYRDIESVTIRQTPLTRRTRRVSVNIATNADDMTVRSIPLDDALEIINYILRQAAVPHASGI